MEYNLTKDADALLCLLYGVYRKRLEESNDEEDDSVCDLGGIDEIYELVSSKFSKRSTAACCNELSNKGLINGIYASGTLVFATLETDGIAYVEAKNKGVILKTIKEVLGVAAPIAEISTLLIQVLP